MYFALICYDYFSPIAYVLSPTTKPPTMFKHLLLLTVVCTFLHAGYTQTETFLYEPSADHPYGLPNPDAPKELLDWSDLIGECQCRSVSRNPDGSWQDTVDMTWRFKYIMNGWGVQDETLKADGKHSGSIRQYNPDSSSWYVHYYSSAGATPLLSAWEGNKQEDGKITLYRDQPAPNGMEGDYKITFSDISPDGFNWTGEWVNKGETFSYPTWYISCKKQRDNSNEQQYQQLMKNIEAFSRELVAGNATAIADMYTPDGKIFPGGRQIMEGRDALIDYWTPSQDDPTSYHKIMPEEIKFIGDYAYDFGYYEGRTLRRNGLESEWAGKYVIIWKRVGEDWKIYLDIWNRI